MTRQIAVRLPDDLVAFIDQTVEAGLASSRAVVVARAIEREQRRQAAARDARILAQGNDPEPEWDNLAEYGARIPLDLV